MRPRRAVLLFQLSPRVCSLVSKLLKLNRPVIGGIQKFKMDRNIPIPRNFVPDFTQMDAAGFFQNPQQQFPANPQQVGCFGPPGYVDRAQPFLTHYQLYSGLPSEEERRKAFKFGEKMALLVGHCMQANKLNPFSNEDWKNYLIREIREKFHSTSPMWIQPPQQILPQPFSTYAVANATQSSRATAEGYLQPKSTCDIQNILPQTGFSEITNPFQNQNIGLGANAFPPHLNYTETPHYNILHNAPLGLTQPTHTIENDNETNKAPPRRYSMITPESALYDEIGEMQTVIANGQEILNEQNATASAPAIMEGCDLSAILDSPEERCEPTEHSEINTHSDGGRIENPTAGSSSTLCHAIYASSQSCLNNDNADFPEPLHNQSKRPRRRAARANVLVNRQLKQATTEQRNNTNQNAKMVGRHIVEQTSDVTTADYVISPNVCPFADCQFRTPKTRRTTTTIRDAHVKNKHGPLYYLCLTCKVYYSSRISAQEHETEHCNEADPKKIFHL